ncbi:hypothetical protein SCOR_00500 [Sulfidibacter corallicola]
MRRFVLELPVTFNIEDGYTCLSPFSRRWLHVPVPVFPFFPFLPRSNSTSLFPHDERAVEAVSWAEPVRPPARLLEAIQDRSSHILKESCPLLKRRGAFNLRWVLPLSDLNHEARKERNQEKQGHGAPPNAYPFLVSDVHGFLLHSLEGEPMALHQKPGRVWPPEIEPVGSSIRGSDRPWRNGPRSKKPWPRRRPGRMSAVGWLSILTRGSTTWLPTCRSLPPPAVWRSESRICPNRVGIPIRRIPGPRRSCVAGPTAATNWRRCS